MHTKLIRALNKLESGGTPAVRGSPVVRFEPHVYQGFTGAKAHGISRGRWARNVRRNASLLKGAVAVSLPGAQYSLDRVEERLSFIGHTSDVGWIDKKLTHQLVRNRFRGIQEHTWMLQLWLDKDDPERLAFQSCSWGPHQIMGFNWRLLGLSSPMEFLKVCFTAEHNDWLVLLARFFHNHRGIRTAMAARDWKQVGKLYNGSERYGLKLHTLMEG